MHGNHKTEIPIYHNSRLQNVWNIQAIRAYYAQGICINHIPYVNKYPNMPPTIHTPHPEIIYLMGPYIKLAPCGVIRSIFHPQRQRIKLRAAVCMCISQNRRWTPNNTRNIKHLTGQLPPRSSVCSSLVALLQCNPWRQIIEKFWIMGSCKVSRYVLLPRNLIVNRVLGVTLWHVFNFFD